MNSYDGSQEHRIRKLVFDFRYPDEATAFRVRKRLEDLASTATIPVLEKALDAYGSGSHEVRLDRLELDLGRISASDLDGEVIRRAIAEELGRKLRGAVSAETVSSPQAASPVKALIAYLTTGSWPWDAPYRTLADAEAALRSLAPDVARRAAARLLTVLHEPAASRRLVYQFGAGLAEWIVRSAHGEAAETLIRAGREAAGMAAAKQFALALLAVSAALPPGQAVVREQVEHLWAAALLPAPAGTERIPPAADTAPAPPSFEPDTAIPSAGERRGAPEPPTEVASSNDLYVEYAGIVLLHPFLPRFFAHLNLLDERQQFVSLDGCVRGVHLLHYLATGLENPAEPATVLLKVLCGLPIAFPLPHELPLADQERDEAESLLSAAIGHWTKLGNTSPAGLREAFLQREGKLAPDEQGWRLAVEQRAVDVLLGHLPWGLSIVRLPWVKTPLWVDWA